MHSRGYARYKRAPNFYCCFLSARYRENGTPRFTASRPKIPNLPISRKMISTNDAKHSKRWYLIP